MVSGLEVVTWKHWGWRLTNESARWKYRNIIYGRGVNRPVDSLSEQYRSGLLYALLLVNLGCYWAFLKYNEGYINICSYVRRKLSWMPFENLFHFYFFGIAFARGKETPLLYEYSQFKPSPVILTPHGPSASAPDWRCSFLQNLSAAARLITRVH